MPCLHGLDEINCPTCRIIRGNIPQDKYSLKDLYRNPFLKRNFDDKEKIFNEVIARPSNINQVSLKTNLKPIFLNKIPSFENKMFLERLREIDVSKTDTFGFSKNIPLENPEWKFDEGE